MELPPTPAAPSPLRGDASGSSSSSSSPYSSFPINLAWDDLCFSVEGRPILKHLTGQAIAGRSLAIMGSSGAGKTTLLNAMARRLDSDGSGKALSGAILLNEVPIDSVDYRKLIGFVPQDDILGQMSTPNSALNFTIRVRLGVSVAEAQRATDAMLEKLKLTACRDTIVGVPGVVAGLSGGERKRLNIGTELIADTKLLLCDEPTSGLDSSTSLVVVKALQQMAREGNRTVLFTIHQPTLAMTRHFDDILLLTNGHAVYHGPMASASRYFAAVGFPCPDTFTPTDHFMVLLQDARIARLLVGNWRRYCRLRGLPCGGGGSDDGETDDGTCSDEEQTREGKQKMEKALDGAARDPAEVPPSSSSSPSVARLPISNNAPDYDANDDVPMGPIVDAAANGRVMNPSSATPPAPRDDADEHLPPHVRAQRDAYAPCSDADLLAAYTDGHRYATAEVTAAASSDAALNNHPSLTTATPTPHDATITALTTAAFIEAYLAHIRPSAMIQWVELLKRCWAFVYTNQQFMTATIVQTIAFGLMAGLVFFNVEDTVTGIQDRFGLFFMLIFTSALTNAMGVVNRFKPIRELYVREQQSGSYPVFTYFACSFLVDIPLFSTMVMVQTIIVYFMTGLHRSAHNFFYFYAILLTLCNVGLSIGYALSAMIQHDMLATACIPPVIIPMLLCGGLVATNDQIRPYWYWMEKLSMIRSGFLLMVHLELPTVPYLACDEEKFRGSCRSQPRSGEEYIAYRDFNSSHDQPWAMWLQLAALLVITRGLHLAGLYRTAHRKF